MNTSQEPIRILVADDDESLRSVLEQVLSMDGFVVTVTASGEEALEAFKKEPYPLIFTDIRMGRMSGMDLLKEVKQLRPDTEIVIMTSYAALDTAMTAIKAGAYDYLAKPFEDISLISSVAQRAVEKIRLAAENKNLVGKLQQQYENLERANATLKELSIRDGLTNLYNHRYFQESLSQEIHRSKRHARMFSLIFLDVDFFKQYNDTHGHPAGDLILIELSHLLKNSIRRTDIIARYGGEEFVLLLPETTRERAHAFAETIRTKIADFPFPGRNTQPEGRITVSMGIAEYPQDGSDSASLLQHADTALYQAKESGRNAVR
jgi:diguanylate cyclase (GGDEF)-like protein